MKLIRSRLAILCLTALLAILVVAPSAQATERKYDYAYSAWIRSLNNPSCWYTREGCSPWDYWTSNFVAYGSVGGQILQGYENQTVIRGLLFTPSSAGQYTVYPSQFNMGGYLKANVVWWTGGDTYIVNAEAYHP
jgi:hypothetical protein